MLLIDTSVWIKLFGDTNGKFKQALVDAIDDRDYYLSRFSQTELLQGAKNDHEWAELNNYLSTQEYVDPSIESWSHAAQIYYDLRRQGITVSNTIACLIAASAIEHELLLLHDDRDFEAVASGTNLNELRI